VNGLLGIWEALAIGMAWVRYSSRQAFVAGREGVFIGHLAKFNYY
jgi:hypothetical protein